MAEIARRLPKWQAEQILCQTICQNGIGEIFPDYFFYLQNADTKCRTEVSPPGGIENATVCTGSRWVRFRV